MRVVLGADLRLDGVVVVAHGLLAEVQELGDRLAAEAGGEQPQDFGFAR